MELIRLGLQFFAEGAAASGAAATAAAGGTAAGAPATPTGEGANTPDASGPEGEPDLDAEFQELIKGKYRAQYSKLTSATVQNRLKASKGENARLAEENAKYRAFIDGLSDEFDADDLESLKKKLAEDRSRRVEDEAIRTGKTSEEVEEKISARSELRRAQREAAQLKAEKEEQARITGSQKILQGWRDQSEGLSEKYPGFDLDYELANNEAFVSMLVNDRTGKVTVEGAYVASHGDEALRQAMQYAAARGTEVAAARFANNAKRPTEGALQKTTAGASVVDVKNMTRKQRDEIKKRVEKGERITFG